MSDVKTARLISNFTTVQPIFNLLGIFSVAVMKEEGEHHYLSLCSFGYVLEIHFVGNRFKRIINR